MGIIPAAGFARRMPGGAGSKEVFPLPPDGEPVAAHALRALAQAGIEDILMIIRAEKGDIPASLGSGSSWGVGVEYLETDPTRGPVETLDRAYDRVRGATVALALPDLLMTCRDPYTPLLSALHTGPGEDAVLGVFPASSVQPADPVLFDGAPPTLSSTRSGALPAHPQEARPILAIEPKRPGEPEGHGQAQGQALGPQGQWCWGLAVWSPPMTDFIHEEVARGNDLDWGGDWGLGGVFNRAVGAGLRLAGVAVSSDPFLDMGTPEGLALALTGRRTAGR
ncbi:MAG: NTP transferase domain-containing protein [Gemmatimonadetes bacterium]|nr:NTP transferase domain-containing protein [Gemmatimonadota bacterium]